jgi:iron complex transport system substrate-binding protein
MIRQRPFAGACCAFILLLGACDRRPAQPTTIPATKSPRVASLVPAATDLLVAMGAGDHLVAVSNWDIDRSEIQHLPRVGDYQSTDWEKLAELRPDVMIVFMAGQRMPAGLRQRAEEMNIRLVNVTTERLADVFANIDSLGDLTNERDKAASLSRRIRSQLDAVSQQVEGKEKIPTLVARDDDGFALIAGDTFVDDLLDLAGGVNVAKDSNTRYPTIDRERVIELAPRAIVQLVPQASPQIVDRARKMWSDLATVPAVRDGRIFILTEWYVLQPGSHVGDLAQSLALKLHPQ